MGYFESKEITLLREHIRADKAAPYLSQSFIYFIDFIHKFHTQIRDLEFMVKSVQNFKIVCLPRFR